MSGKIIQFYKEPLAYEKGIMSDLQGAWECFRESVINVTPSELQHKLIFHIDEAMSWENVRDLNKMRKTINIIATILGGEKTNKEIQEWFQDIQDIFEKIQKYINNDDNI